MSIMRLSDITSGRLNRYNSFGDAKITIPNYILYLRFDEGNNSNVIKDSSRFNHTIHKNGSIEIREDKKKYGVSSLYCNDYGEYIYTDLHSCFNLHGESFTIDFWFYLNGNNMPRNSYAWFNITNVSPGTDSTYCWQRCGPYYFEYYVNNTRVLSNNSFDPSDYTWHHFEISRDISTHTWRAFYDGQLLCSSVNNADFLDEDHRVYIATGRFQDTYHYFFHNSYGNGWLDEFRIAKGIVKHTSNFSV
ncbi:MAG: LamG-like jellyroll fold domain-containing protein [Candidatus Njordarchaeia archaeon]